MTKVSDCPFCGACWVELELVYKAGHTASPMPEPDRTAVLCRRCGACGPMVKSVPVYSPGYSEPIPEAILSAIAKWNIRR